MNQSIRFQNLEELKVVSAILKESDFDGADCLWEAGGGVFQLKTTRPPSELLKGGGLFRKPRSEWIRCRLVIRNVRNASIWEEYDVKPPVEGLLDGTPEGNSFRVEIRSAHGIRIDLRVDRLEGVLEDL